MSTKYKIKELDLNNLRPLDINDESGAKYAFIGKPGVGKSQAILQLAYTKKHIIPVAEVYSGSERYDPFYKQYFPDLCIHDDFDFTAKNDEGLTPIEVAVKAGNVETVKAMKDYNYSGKDFAELLQRAQVNFERGKDKENRPK